MLLNENVTLLPESGISVKKRVGEFLEENPSSTLLHLDQSLMNMPLPEEVTNGMKQAVDEIAAPFGTRLSGPWSGYESLKKAVSQHLEKFSVKIPEGDVYITSGLESAYACLSHLFAPDNNVLLSSPCDGHLQELCQCAGRNISFVRAMPENDFAPEPDGTPTDLIYLASPHPVTGAVLTREKLQKWVDFANDCGAVIFYDASLSEYIEEDGFPHSIYEIEGAKDCAIQVFSFETGYGVKELKIAYVVIPYGLTRENVRLADLFSARQPSTATPPSFVMQHAAQILLSPEAEEGTQKILYRIKKVARTLSQGLTRAGIPHVGGENSPFLWAQCPQGTNSWQCFDALLEKGGCVVTPGSLYGFGGEGFFRLTSFGLPEEAQEACERFATALVPEKEETPLESEEESAARLFQEDIPQKEEI